MALTRDKGGQEKGWAAGPACPRGSPGLRNLGFPSAQSNWRRVLRQVYRRQANHSASDLAPTWVGFGTKPKEDNFAMGEDHTTFQVSGPTSNLSPVSPYDLHHLWLLVLQWIRVVVPSCGSQSLRRVCLAWYGAAWSQDSYSAGGEETRRSSQGQASLVFGTREGR